MIMKFRSRTDAVSFIWVDLSEVLAIAHDGEPWEIDLHLASDVGITVNIIPISSLDDSDAPEEPEAAFQRVFDAWQSARAKIQNPLLGRRV